MAGPVRFVTVRHGPVRHGRSGGAWFGLVGSGVDG